MQSTRRVLICAATVAAAVLAAILLALCLQSTKAHAESSQLPTVLNLLAAGEESLPESENNISTETSRSGDEFAANLIQKDTSELRENTVGEVSTYSINDSIHLAVNTQISGSCSTSGIENWYKITISSSGVLNINFESDFVDRDNAGWYIRLYDHEQTLIDQDKFWCGGIVSKSVCKTGLPAGDYYISIRSLAGYGGYHTDTTYRMSTGFISSESWETEFNNNVVQSDRISAATTFYGISSNSGDEDWFVFSTKNNIRASLLFGSEYYDNDSAGWLLTLYDASKNQIAHDKFWCGGIVNEKIFDMELVEGTYYLMVRSVVGYGGYHAGAAYNFKICDSSYSDVDPSAWFADSVTYASSNRLITGYSGTSLFGPTDSLTRAQAAVVLWRYFTPEEAASYDAGKTENVTGLTDVEDCQWYTGAANWAVRTGTIKGFVQADGGRLFDPDGVITREQLCAIVGNAAEKFCEASVSGADTSALNRMPDAGKVDEWAVESVAWGINSGVISGWDEGGGNRSIRPLQAVDRATMAAVMMNCIQKGVIR